MSVELRATRDDTESRCVIWCDESDADQFSVYLGEPGEFTWAADFLLYLDARRWAQEIAAAHSTHLDDYVEKERHYAQTA
jgi:hypothetical protein